MEKEIRLASNECCRNPRKMYTNRTRLQIMQLITFHMVDRRKTKIYQRDIERRRKQKDSTIKIE